MSIFSSVPISKLSRSTFNLDHENKLSFNFGGLYPILCKTILPGDRISLGLQSFVRTVPLLSPVMHRNDIKVDSFFVPMRLIWDNYEKWLQCSDSTIKMPKWKLDFPLSPNGITSSVYKTYLGSGSLADYLGFASVAYNTFPNKGTGKDVTGRTLNLLPFRTYQLIYDFYYRNKALEPSIFDDPNYDIKGNSDFTLDVSGSELDYFKLRYRSWRRDPFTSALPDPQKGNPVLIPESTLTATGTGNVTGIDISSDGPLGFVNGDDQPLSDHNANFYKPADENESFLYDSLASAHYKSGLKATGTGTISGVDITKSNQPTIEDLRYAEVLEEYEEALARSGAGNTGSFKEWLLSIWRTLSPDARLDRPEYLGGYRGPIQISEVPQTSSATESSPQGTLAGKGLSVGGNLLFKKYSFKEPGYLMVIMSVVPKSAYFQGDPREFLYDNCYDFPNPYFANLGEQEVLSQEINAAAAINNSTYQQKTFGYQVRNYEMKQIPDSVHGALRDSLLYWHEARTFNEGVGSQYTVNLNENFIKMYPEEVSRIFPSSESSDKLIGEFFFNMRAKRSLPYYGVPRIGHN